MRFAAYILSCLFIAPALAAEPPWPTATWPTSTPEAQGMSSGTLADLIDTVGTRMQDSVLVERHGRIVAEAYYAPYRPGIPHDLRSGTKSITGTLTAIEIKGGLLDSVDHSVIDLFKDMQIQNIDANKQAMTVQTLLNMTSGIKWLEHDYTPNETIMQMYHAPDRAQFVLDQPMSDPPGAKFYYNSGNPYLLSAIITRRTGMNAEAYARQKLFGPLGITTAHWGKPDAQNVTDGEAGLYLDPRDMLKIGYLYLHNGLWDGQQIIPAAWVAYAEAGAVPAVSGLHYANLWWSRPDKGALMALGRHSQRILVLPKYDIVAVLTGYMPDDEYYPVPRFIDDIIAAVKSDQALPPDPIGQSALAASIGAAANGPPLPVGATPPLQAIVSGRIYQLDTNRLDITTIALRLTGTDPMVIPATNDGKPGTVTRYYPEPLGLDGRWRLAAPAWFGIAALRARWVSDTSLEIQRRILGFSSTQRWTLTFDGNDISMHFADTDGGEVDLHGHAE